MRLRDTGGTPLLGQGLDPSEIQCDGHVIFPSPQDRFSEGPVQSFGGGIFLMYSVIIKDLAICGCFREAAGEKRH